MGTTYDFVVIGSGVSGGRIAHDLTRGGARVALLEAGRHFTRDNFPPDEIGYTAEMFWSGGLEVTKDGTLGMMRGRCLGGTSVLNQADLSRFDQLAWDDWRDRSGIDWLTPAVMDPIYDELDSTVIHGQIPSRFRNRSAELFIDALDGQGIGWEPIDRAQADCKLDMGSDCIVCLGGCPRDSKQSTLVAQIPQAIDAGLRVETEWEVERIVERPFGTVGIHGTHRGNRATIEAREVVLAAGAFGNAQLLSNSGFGDDLKALGSGFSCHPQMMSFGLYDEPVDSHKGALQSVEGHDPAIRQAGLKLENVFAPPIAIAMLMPGFGTDHHALMRRYRHLSCFEVAIRDDNSGTLGTDRRGRLVIDKSLTDADRHKVAAGRDLSAELHHKAGARSVVFSDQLFGLHLMGGASLGVDPDRSVVGPDFRVHRHPRLRIADSSVFPSAPGINPSYTIMALSHMASREMLEQV
ncbi:MAG: GMC family oxidoreductase [Actinobacteria bacterium]|nr:GMC family oxidoreductase [Actinomycetota bacterium]MCB9388805.1 GMC family oxidoreductase [Acidimicrobiia bacterium]